ncbi:MAG: hypothetical protein IRZ16_13055 [Myxococcaceae bacterium]|nr:hypothetical protein [Myxococcaceae bacterium]
MRRNRFTLAVVLSLALHGAIGLLVWRTSERSAAVPPAGQAPLELEIVELPPDPAPTPPRAPQKVAPPEPEKRKADRPREVKKPEAIADASPPPARGDQDDQKDEAPPAAPGAPGTDATARAPGKLELFPTLPFGNLPVGTGDEAPSHGHTIRPDDPSLSAEVQKLEEEHRVKGRVDGWANDALAEARAGVAAGGGHPWFRDVGEAMTSAFLHQKDATPKQLGAPSMGQMMFNRWTRGLEDYGKTGNPNIGVPGQAPTQSEILKERFGSEAQGVQALSQAARTAQDLQQGKPLLSVKFELFQNADGRYKKGTILEGSGSPVFDAFVLRVVPGALESLGPPPPEVLRGRDEVRSVWLIEGWQAYTKLELQLPAVGIEGVPLNPIRHQLRPEDRKFDFRAKLLRAY